MNLLDRDLISVQEVRSLLKKAYEAQKKLATFSQEQIDRITKAMAEAGEREAVRLAKMANEETHFGKWEDKVIKNIFGSKMIYEAIKDQKTVGIIKDDVKNKVLEIGIPVGVIAGIVPSTNPTSTAFYKSLIAIKGGNGIVFSPHPGAKNCTLEAVKVVAEAAHKAGAPEGIISCISVPSMEGTQELMKNSYTSLILATGGGAMVRAAYSSGTPAIGVGAGNGPAFIDKSADVKLAVKRILDSKTFDNGTICASEQSIIVEKCMENEVLETLKNQGACLLDAKQSDKLAKFILRPNGTMNPQIVGKSVAHIVKLAGLEGVPSTAKVLVAKETRVGHDVPYSKEKLAPILAFYVEEDVDAVLKKCVEILHFEGSGHTFCMHANDDALVRRFAVHIPASRMLINTPGSLGGVGATTNLFPALTLGCGAIGGSSSSNNIGPMDVINIKRVAYGVMELEEIRKNTPCSAPEATVCTGQTNEAFIDALVKKIMKELI